MYGNAIFVQKVYIDGQCLWGEYGTRVCQGNWFTGFANTIVPDGRGGVLNVWEDERSGPNNAHLYFQHLDAQGHGLLPFNGVPVLYPSGNPMGEGVGNGVPDGQGGGVWLRVVGDISTDDIVLFKLNGRGQTQWCWISIHSYWRHQTGPLLRHPVLGTLWLSSAENRQGGQNYSSYLYCWDINGHPLFGPNGIPDGALLVPTSDGVISWRGQENGQATWITAQRRDTAGQLIWESTVALGGVTPGGGIVLGVADCVSDGQDGTVVALVDRREQPADLGNISAQRVLADGSLGNPPPPVYYYPGGLTLDLSGGLVRYTPPSPGWVALELYDLLGRRVSCINQSYRQAGAYLEPFDQQILATGAYVLRLQTPLQSQATRIVMAK